jgi:hypothetical protein
MVALVAAALLAGCFSGPTSLDGSGGPGPGNGREVAFTVLAAEREAGRCFDGATAFGDVCDRLVVRVDNSGYTNALAVGTLQWTARDADGRSMRGADTDGYDEVPPGEVRDIPIGFTMDDGGAKLTELRYEGFQGHGSRHVPSY